MLRNVSDILVEKPKSLTKIKNNTFECGRGLLSQGDGGNVVKEGLIIIIFLYI